jgi:hypothetical protein
MDDGEQPLLSMPTTSKPSSIDKNLITKPEIKPQEPVTNAFLIAGSDLFAIGMSTEGILLFEIPSAKK